MKNKFKDKNNCNHEFVFKTMSRIERVVDSVQDGLHRPKKCGECNQFVQHEYKDGVMTG